MNDEYIRRDDAIEEINKWLDFVGTALVGKGMSYYGELIGCIEDTPAADVAPVVRCKDCEFSRELTKTEKKIWLDECRACESPEASQDGYMIVFPEHFCSYGRRKEQCD